MNRTSELTARKATILRALVTHYIRTGEPVGSEAIATHSGLGVSSATIRNELAALEELGFLVQPHTSAGRIPTDVAYRYYVDLLPSRPRLRDAERRAIVLFFDEALADIDEILRGTTVLLSRLTRYASLALAPSSRESAIVRCELIGLGSATLLLVVFDTGRVDKRVVEVPPELDAEALEGLSRRLNEMIHGRTAEGAQEILQQRVDGAAGAERTLLERVRDSLGLIHVGSENEHVVLGGVANLAAEDAFHRTNTMRQILETLERESVVLSLLRGSSGAPVSVTIGHENPVEAMWETSMVAAQYAVSGSALGTIGVFGPTRMDYAAAIATVRVVADRLSAAVEALHG